MKKPEKKAVGVPAQLQGIKRIWNHRRATGLVEQETWSVFLLFWPHLTACGFLAPQPGIEPGPQQLKCSILTTGPPWSSLGLYFK